MFFLTMAVKKIFLFRKSLKQDNENDVIMRTINFTFV